MEDDISRIIQLLDAVGYEHKHYANEDELAQTIKDGTKSIKFRELISWITNEIRVLANIDEKVNSDGEINDFMIELSGFLKEMLCPFQSLITGPVSQRLETVESKQILLEYLITELMALKMCHQLKPKESVVIEVSESPAAASLKTITNALNIGVPPSNISVNVMFDKIVNRVNETIKKNGPDHLGKPLFNPSKELTASQWKQLEKLQKELDAEYDIRRQMLITRLDVTIQSFQWSDKTHGKEDKIAARYNVSRQQLEGLRYGGHRTDLTALLTARDDVAIIEKTSNANVRKNTKTAIQKHVMGKVPDRGGRAYEHAPPPPEMPFWQKRTEGGGAGGGGRGGHGGSQPQRSGGNRNFGGNQQKSGNYQQQGGNYQQQGSGGNYQQQGSGNYQQGGGNYQQGGGNYQQGGGNYQQYSGGYQQNTGGYNNNSNRGSGRVQGGWSKHGSGDSQDYNSGHQGGNRGYNSAGNDNSNSGGFGNDRGYSNYRRGGGGRR